MKQLNLFLELTRLKRPIGYMLLFWPCSWGLAIGYDFSKNLETFFFYLVLFLVGSILMRSAGCIVNDILDRKFDKEVSRTKHRPIASGKITVNLGLFYSSLLCLFAFFVLINFNLYTIILALASMPLAFTYPLMKRYTYWPQLFLGITFNYGLILGWTSMSEQIDIVPIIFYIGAIFWTLGYDTIYGYQDIKDDEIIGVKSTSIKFKNNPKKFLYTCYSLTIISLILTGLFMKFKLLYFLFIIIPIIHLLYFQVYKLKGKNPKIFLNKFKSNNFLGLIVFVNILIGKIV